MTELNVNVLVAAKDEYTKQLITTIQTPIYEIIKNVYTESQKNNGRLKISYSNFQYELKKVPNWASFKLEENLNEINSKFPYLMDLITAIFVSHVKILACVRLKSESKSIKIKVPNLNTFLHKIIISVSENIYYNPYIIHDNKDSIYNIINNSINETIANLIPIEYILNEYLSGVFEEDDETKLPENITEEPHGVEDYISDIADDEYEEETKNIPIIPIDNKHNRKPIPEKLDEAEIKTNEEPITHFDDLSQKRDALKSLKVDKKEDIDDESDESGEEDYISDEEENINKTPTQVPAPAKDESDAPTLF